MFGLWVALLVGCGEGWLFSGTETENDPSSVMDSDTDDSDTDVS